METTTNTQQAEALATQAATIVASRFRNAVRYAEAYGHDGRTCVIDGSMYSPSTRAIPNASLVWDMDDDEAWETFEYGIDTAIDNMDVDEDTDSEAPDVWTLGWDEGCLFAYSPDWTDEPNHA